MSELSTVIFHKHFIHLAVDRKWVGQIQRAQIESNFNCFARHVTPIILGNGNKIENQPDER